MQSVEELLKSDPEMIQTHAILDVVDRLPMYDDFAEQSPSCYIDINGWYDALTRWFIDVGYAVLQWRTLHAPEAEPWTAQPLPTAVEPGEDYDPFVFVGDIAHIQLEPQIGGRKFQAIRKQLTKDGYCLADVDPAVGHKCPACGAKRSVLMYFRKRNRTDIEGEESYILCLSCRRAIHELYFKATGEGFVA